MNARSTHAVVGLCGNDRTITRGRGHASSHASRRLSKKSCSGPRRTWRTSAPAKIGPQMWIGYDGLGHERGVARAEQHPHEVREALLGPDRRAGLGLGVELDPERALVQVGDREAELRDAPARRVAVVARVADGFAELVDRDVGRRQVGVAEPEVDDVLAGPPGLHLQRVDRGEDVRAAARRCGGTPSRRPVCSDATVPGTAPVRFPADAIRRGAARRRRVFHLPAHPVFRRPRAGRDQPRAEDLDRAHYAGVAAIDDFTTATAASGWRTSLATPRRAARPTSARRDRRGVLRRVRVRRRLDTRRSPGPSTRSTS